MRDFALKSHSPLIFLNEWDDLTSKWILDFLLSIKSESIWTTLESSLERNKLFLPLLNNSEEFLNNLFPEDHRLIGVDTGTVILNNTN